MFVELGSERVKVGAVRAGSGFQLVAKSAADGPSFRVIDLPSQPGLVLEKTARWVVGAAELEPCSQGSRGMQRARPRARAAPGARQCIGPPMPDLGEPER